MLEKIINFKLKGFLKKRARWIVKFLNSKFDINTSQKNQLVSLHILWQRIYNFEKMYPVNCLKIQNTYIYPFLRNYLWIRMTMLSNKGIDVDSPYILQGGGESKIPYRIRQAIKKRLNAVEIEELQENKVDILFFTHISSGENLTVGGKIYQRLTDPFVEEFSKTVTVKKIGIVKSSDIDLTPDDFHHPYIPLIYPYIFKRGYAEELPFSWDFLDVLKKTTGLKFTKDSLKIFFDWEFFIKDWYKELLLKLKPKLVVCHHLQWNAPLFVAAQELGIKTADIQDGELIGGVNPTYNGWYKIMPREGYESLPNYFFMRSEKDCRHIEKEFTGLKHKAVLLGNPYLYIQKRFISGFIKNKYNNMFKKYNKIVVFLLAMDLPDIFKDIVANSNEDVLFILRHHPNPVKKFSINDFFIPHNNLLIGDDFDNCVIGELFNVCDCAISSGSAASKEFVQWKDNVASFVFNKVTSKHYQMEIDEGNLIFINDCNEFYEHLKKGTLSLSFEETKINTQKAIQQFITEELKG
ncbi:hypothetical protein L8V88_00705 [Campylobacter sp. IFREMER_LSEM_CL2101]|uniref:hypothetical protein n=1 Tax=Campylobacter sp. IFREMER_LSEM_CL2101 TaxID=2911618 RepID=UPI0021E7F8DE|nr:hypothetical protein [Campylobacter sp. IFREMER_LSEM_CL2101]MCV3391537.1 hypothetical protein [Campylobacter sp. IFREMER_LSEM_CL2101]